MKTTIDPGGRVVVPKAMRDRLGLKPGAEVEVIESDGSVEIRPAVAAMALVEVDERLVAQVEGIVPLTDELVRETLERTRR